MSDNLVLSNGVVTIHQPELTIKVGAGRGIRSPASPDFISETDQSPWTLLVISPSPVAC